MSCTSCLTASIDSVELTSSLTTCKDPFPVSLSAISSVAFAGSRQAAMTRFEGEASSWWTVSSPMPRDALAASQQGQPRTCPIMYKPREEAYPVISQVSVDMADEWVT